VCGKTVFLRGPDLPEATIIKIMKIHPDSFQLACRRLGSGKKITCWAIVFAGERCVERVNVAVG
jgi:hypothetical protein